MLRRVVLVVCLSSFFIGSWTGDAIGQGDAQPRILLCFGDSLTAGYGLEQPLAFPALLQQKIDDQAWNFKTINAGLSGETSAGGLRRIDWLLRQQVDVLLLELGVNDGFRGIDPKTIYNNLQGIIDRTRKKYPHVEIIVAGMLVPPNLGRDYAAQFRDVFPRLAQANGAALIPFLLQDVGGRPQLNLPDGIHPTAAGHQIVADNVWKVLQPVLQSLQ
jgi:acyl-CoA thioesterase-1